MHHKRAEAEEIHCVTIGKERRIFIPNVPREIIDDRRMIGADKHPHVKVSPGKEAISRDVFVECWVARISIIIKLNLTYENLVSQLTSTALSQDELSLLLK